MRRRRLRLLSKTESCQIRQLSITICNMSQTYYQQLWRETQDDLKKAISLDAKIKKKGPTKDLYEAKRLVGHLFTSYVSIVNRLDHCYDQMFHPQKREVISRLVETSLGRLLELKSEIARIELDDYSYFDNILIELKLTHHDMEIKVPKYFWKEKEKEKAHRRELIQQAIAKAEKEVFKEKYLKSVPEEEKESAWEKYLREEENERIEREKFEEQQRKLKGPQTQVLDSLEDFKKKLKEEEEEGETNENSKQEIVKAILLIQRHERARQGRILSTTKSLKNELKRTGRALLDAPAGKAEKAAKIIQEHWRRYGRRVREARRKEFEAEILGMTEPRYKDKKKLQKLKRQETINRKQQDKNQREYEEALVTVKDKVTTWYTDQMEEDTVDEIRGWFEWFFQESGFLPDYPPSKPIIPTGEILGIPKKLGSEFIAKTFPQMAGTSEKSEKGMNLAMALAGISELQGSALVVAGHWITPQQFLTCQIALEKMKKSGKTAPQKPEKPSKEALKEMKKKQKEQEKRMRLAEEQAGFQLKDSNYLTPLKKADKDYRVTWMNLDESKNYNQKYVKEFIKDDKCWELSVEVRKIVDEMMVLELERFKDALWRDKNPKKKQKKKKPKKEKKKKKKKEKKDPTGDRTLDDLFLELYRNGIIKDYEEAHIEDYLGERSFAAFDFRQRNLDWPPSTGDVRDVIIQLCVLPLGSKTVHQLSPLIKSVLLMGIQGAGKRLLSRIICTETSAVMFDLTPENVAGKYPGKDGLKMLQHLIEKMSRALQPSVIFVDRTEKTFYKKVPKEEKEMDPKRLTKVIQKVVKGIKPPDQVLVLGTCCQPWLAQRNKLLKTYQKIIMVPQMDYGSYAWVWKNLLNSYHSIPLNFNVSCLAKASTGYSFRDIMNAVEKIMTTERISSSPYNPYKPIEFLTELIQIVPLEEKLIQKCFDFYSKTDMPKKRTKRMKEIQEAVQAKKG